MNSNNQIPNEDEDTRILQNIFPTEVWQLILNNVHQPDDYTRISNSSPAFKNSLLVPQWNRVVFPKILDLIEHNCFGYHPVKGKNVILKMRLICRSWKSAVDRFLQNFPEHFLFEKEMVWGAHRDDPRPKQYRAENLRCIVRCFQDVTRFRTKFDASHLPRNLNPLVNREFQVRVDSNTVNFLEFVQANLGMLRDYGPHVWYFKLHVYYPDETRNPEQLETFGVGNWIRDILFLLPNLRTLRFAFYPDKHIVADKQPWQQKFAEMQEYWIRNDMPHFPNISFLGETGLPWPMLTAILRANPQLASLETNSLTRAATTTTYEMEMPKYLQNLSITIRNLDQLKIIENAKVHWQLMKLCINGREHYSDGELLRITRVMSAAQSKFGQTLRKLHVLRCERPSIYDNVRLRKMPKLEFFHLSVSGMAPDFSFLSPLGPTLKTLYVQIESSILLHTKLQRARFLKQKNLTGQDTFWRMFSNLQSFTVILETGYGEWRCYTKTRKQWKWEKDQAENCIQT